MKAKAETLGSLALIRLANSVRKRKTLSWIQIVLKMRGGLLT
jgi:hypothetical protein